MGPGAEGSRNVYKLEGRERYIVQKLADGDNKKAIARRLHVRRDTLARFIDERGLDTDIDVTVD